MLTMLSLLFAANVTASASSSIHARVRGTNDPLVVELLRRQGSDSWSEVAQRALPVEKREIDFDQLYAGVYQVRVRRAGGGPPAAAKVIVGTAERRTADIDVDPIEVLGRIALGDVPLSHAAIVLTHAEFQWQVPMVADDKGQFHATLWQRGPFRYSVGSSALAASYADRIDIGGRLPFRWDLRLPDRRVVGVVRDRVSGAAIAGAKLHVHVQTAERKRHINAQAGNDGRLDLAAMPVGVVTIEAASDGYLETTSAPVTLAASDREREVAISLEPGTAVPMTVSDSSGHPLAGARVLTVVDGNVRAHATTGSDGRTRVTLPHDGAATLYAIPLDGSFAVVHVVKADQAPQRITTPRPASSLHIVTRTTDGKALPNVALLMRANGELFPPEVAEEMEALQELSLRTDEHGEALLRNLPPGSYEFWPYSAAEEAEAIVETAASLLAPIVVKVKTGENSVAVNFRAR